MTDLFELNNQYLTKQAACKSLFQDHKKTEANTFSKLAKSYNDLIDFLQYLDITFSNDNFDNFKKNELQATLNNYQNSFNTFQNDFCEYRRNNQAEYKKYFENSIKQDFKDGIEFIKKVCKTKNALYNHLQKMHDWADFNAHSDPLNIWAGLDIDLIYNSLLATARRNKEVDPIPTIEQIENYSFAFDTVRRLYWQDYKKDILSELDYFVFGADTIPNIYRLPINLYFGDLDGLPMIKDKITERIKKPTLKTVNYSHYALMLKLWLTIINSTHADKEKPNVLVITPGGSENRNRTVERLLFLQNYEVNITVKDKKKKAKQFQFKTIKQTTRTEKGFEVKRDGTILFIPTAAAIQALKEIQFIFTSQFDFDEINSDLDFVVFLYVNEAFQNYGHNNNTVKIDRFINDFLPGSIKKSKSYSKRKDFLKKDIISAFQKFTSCNIKTTASNQIMIEYQHKHGYFDFDNLSYSKIKEPIKPIKTINQDKKTR